MSKVKPVDQCKTASDFDRAIRASRQPYNERQNGTSHRIYVINSKSVPVPQHKGDIPIGTRRSIIKMLIRAGVVCFLLFLAINWLASTFIVPAVPGFN